MYNLIRWLIDPEHIKRDLKISIIEMDEVVDCYRFEPAGLKDVDTENVFVVEEASDYIKQVGDIYDEDELIYKTLYRVWKNSRLLNTEYFEVGAMFEITALQMFKECLKTLGVLAFEDSVLMFYREAGEVSTVFINTLIKLLLDMHLSTLQDFTTYIQNPKQKNKPLPVEQIVNRCNELIAEASTGVTPETAYIQAILETFVYVP